MATILVAEDELLVQKIVRATIEHRGYVCEVVGNGAECLDRLAKGNPPDLLLLDLVMPKVDGLKVLEALNDEPAESRFPIAVFSGKNEQEYVLKAANLGADDFIIKPFKAGDLTKRIDDLLFTVNETELQTLIRNLRMHDSALRSQFTAVNLKWSVYDMYPVNENGSLLCFALKSGMSPQAVSKVSMAGLFDEIVVFRKCASGWRKIWPRFSNKNNGRGNRSASF